MTEPCRECGALPAEDCRRWNDQPCPRKGDYDDPFENFCRLCHDHTPSDYWYWDGMNEDYKKGFRELMRKILEIYPQLPYAFESMVRGYDPYDHCGTIHKMKGL